MATSTRITAMLAVLLALVVIWVVWPSQKAASFDSSPIHNAPTPSPSQENSPDPNGDTKRMAPASSNFARRGIAAANFFPSETLEQLEESSENESSTPWAPKLGRDNNELFAR